MIDLADAATLLVQQVDESGARSPAEPHHDQIAILARQLWIESGCKDGEDERNWIRAEETLRDH